MRRGWGAGIILFLLLAAAAAQNPPESFGGSAAALASSQRFDLQPKVERASFDLRRPDLHALYDAIAQSYGIRLLYDRDLGTLPVSGDFRLQDVTLKEALDAAASISRTFVAPLDAATGMVAADSPGKRGEYERQILGSFHLDNQITPQQLTEISTALRNIVDLRRVTQDSRTNWITVLGRSHQIDVAEQFIQTLDRPSGEVMLEIDVWELDMNRAREIGLSPPQPFVLQFLGIDSARPAVPLLQWGQVQNLYGLQIPGLTAFLNSSSSLVRSHQTVRLRASDGEEARLLVGSRIPVVTGSISSVVLAEDQTQPGANEGFIPGIQYQDVGVVVHATPRLHAADELTLQLDIALRSVGPIADNGIPTFTNRQLTSQIRLGNDEGYLLGGIFNRTDKSNQSGYPWLSRLPVLGWLFARRQPQESDTELLILVRPTILRASTAKEFASRSIFFGKELTGLPAPVAVPPTEQPAVPPAPGQPPQPGGPPQGVPFPPGIGIVPPGVGTQPGTAPVPGQPPQPGGLPAGVPFPGGVFPQGIGIQPGTAPVPGQPPQPVPAQQPQPIQPGSP